ncbi:MAG: hypothetical protein JRN54_06240 [Nitrososphaerota archaeon]|nr:hypothetical protein [Nitrososphaerota archaeon]
MKAQTPTPEREPVLSGKQIPFYRKTTCHTCRAAKKSLEAQAIPIEPIDIMKHPPSERTQAAGRKVRRKGDDPQKREGIQGPSCRQDGNIRWSTGKIPA